MAVPDFLEHLSENIPDIFQPIRSNVFTSLQCQRCKWISISMANEVLIKLYIPESKRTVTFTDLLAFNSETLIPEASGVFALNVVLKQHTPPDVNTFLTC